MECTFKRKNRFIELWKRKALGEIKHKEKNTSTKIERDKGKYGEKSLNFIRRFKFTNEAIWINNERT